MLNFRRNGTVAPSGACQMTMPSSYLPDGFAFFGAGAAGGGVPAGSAAGSGGAGTSASVVAGEDAPSAVVMNARGVQTRRIRGTQEYRFDIDHLRTRRPKRRSQRNRGIEGGL